MTTLLIDVKSGKVNCLKCRYRGAFGCDIFGKREAPTDWRLSSCKDAELRAKRLKEKP